MFQSVAYILSYYLSILVISGNTSIRSVLEIISWKFVSIPKYSPLNTLGLNINSLSILL